MADNIADCPVCGFPVKENPVGGEALICANCGANLIADDVTIPSGLFWSIITFGLGVLLGPVLLSSTKTGQRWLIEHAKAPK